jgi:hypothetical protein
MPDGAVQQNDKHQFEIYRVCGCRQAQHPVVHQKMMSIFYVFLLQTTVVPG